MQRVLPRIAYMHLKNVDGAVRQRVLDGKLSVADVLWRGRDVPPARWRRRHPGGHAPPRPSAALTGPIVVEQDVADNAAETPLQLATRNLAYMQAIAGRSRSFTGQGRGEIVAARPSRDQGLMASATNVLGKLLHWTE